MKHFNFSKKIKNNSVGFTLIELIISIAIITILSGVFLVNYHGTNRRSEINMVAQKMLSDIHLTQSKSLSMAEYGAITPGGWGVHLEKGESGYIIFADSDENKEYNTGEAEESMGAKIISMDHVIISDIDLAESLDIVFFPPDPEVYFNGDLDREAVITLSDGESEKDIIINFLGVVDVEN